MLTLGGAGAATVNGADMASNGTTVEAVATTGAQRAPRWRRVLVAVLVVVSCILAPLSIVAIWSRNQILDTNRYVENVTPLASNPAIIDAAATNATNALFAQVNVEKVAEDALPARADFLAGPLTTALHEFVEKAAVNALESDEFKTIWEKANRLAHDQVEHALTGGGKVISTKNGHVTLDLTAVLLKIRELLDERGISIFDNVPVNKLALRFELFDASGLESAQQGVNVLNKLSWFLPIISLALLGVAIWLSPRRRRTIIRWGIGVTIGAAVVALLVAVGRGIYLDSVTSASLPRDALAATYDTLIRFLRGGLRALMMLGLLVAFITWVSGPGRNAVRLRNTVSGMVGGMSDTAGGHGLDFGRFGTFVARHRRVLQVSGIVVVLLVLLFANRISASRLFWGVVIVGVYLLAIQFVAQAARVEARVDEAAATTSSSGPA